MFREALGMDRPSIVIRAGDLHARVCECPGPHQRMSLCCEVMRSALALKSGDILLDDTEGEAELAIQYVIPRPEWGNGGESIEPQVFDPRRVTSRVAQTRP
jgi:hypothetical protein